jgi:hypothetical protein
MTVLFDYQQEMVMKIISRQNENFLKYFCDVVYIPPFSGKKRIMLQYIKVTNYDNFFLTAKTKYESEFNAMVAKHKSFNKVINEYNIHRHGLFRNQSHFIALQSKQVLQPINHFDIFNEPFNQQFVFKTLIIIEKESLKSWKNEIGIMDMSEQAIFITTKKTINICTSNYSIIFITSTLVDQFQRLHNNCTSFARVIFDCRNITHFKNYPILSSAFYKIWMWERMTPIPFNPQFEIKNMIITLEDKDIPFKQSNELLIEKKIIACFSLFTISNNIIIYYDKNEIKQIATPKNRMNNLLEYNDICPICRNEQINVPTMLSCCGYVFCATCTKEMTFNNCPCCKADKRDFKYNILNEQENDIMNTLKIILTENTTKFVVININFIFYNIFYKKLLEYIPDIKVANYKNLKEFKQWKNGLLKILIVDDAVPKTDFSKIEFMIHIPFQGKDVNYIYSDVKYLESLLSHIDLNHIITIINFKQKQMIDTTQDNSMTFLPMPPLYRNSINN